MAHCLRQRSRYRRMAAGMAVKHGLQSAYCLYVSARAGGITATALLCVENVTFANRPHSNRAA